MMHTVQNPDGSFTTVDDEKDGMLLYWFSVLAERWIKRKEAKIVKEYPFYCDICNGRFKTKPECLKHIRKEHKIKVDKNGVPI